MPDVLVEIAKVTGIVGLSISLAALVFKYILAARAPEGAIAVEHYRLLQRIALYTFLCALVGVGVYLWDGAKPPPVEPSQARFVRVLPVTSMEAWSHFTKYINFYNAPFSVLDEQHRDFKRDFALTTGNALQVLLFSGRTEASCALFARRLSNFTEAFAQMEAEFPALSDAFEQRLRIRIDTSAAFPAETFFQSRLDTASDAVLVYLSTAASGVHTAEGVAATVKVAILLGRDQLETGDLRYLTFHEKWTDAWGDKRNVGTTWAELRSGEMRARLPARVRACL